MTASSRQAPVRADDITSTRRSVLRRYRSWERFHQGPRQHPPLLATLDKYPDCVLVAGCQRSGTTMLTRIIANSRAFRPLQLTHDDELDAALTLCGQVNLPSAARYCFQTTYLNEQYSEYGSIGPQQRLIWVMRNPYSVVHSMIYNWKRFALAELYAACGAADSPRPMQAWRPWRRRPSRIDMACQAYRGKSSQILQIKHLVPASQVLMVEYDHLVQSPQAWLRRIFEFIGEPYAETYAASVRAGSLAKGEQLTPAERRRVDEVAAPAYRECLALLSSS